MPWTLGQLAQIVDGELIGPADRLITSLTAAGANDPDAITYAQTPKAIELVKNSQVGAVLLPKNESISGIASILVENPQKAFIKLLGLAKKVSVLEQGIHPTAIVDESAQIDPTASIGAYSLISAEVKIAKGAKIYGHCFIGERSELEENVVLYPRVTLYEDVSIGQNSIVHSGAVIGKDGFGFQWDGSQHQRVPHIGKVEIGHNVEVGANTTIAKATCRKTIIGDGTKIDDLVMVAHNVRIGQSCILAGTVAVSGSCKIGNGVIMGGQVAVADHVTIADGVRLGARSGVKQDITQAGDYFGTPAKPLGQELRRMAADSKLPELVKKISSLEKELKALKAAINDSELEKI